MIHNFLRISQSSCSVSTVKNAEIELSRGLPVIFVWRTVAAISEDLFTKTLRITSWGQVLYDKDWSLSPPKFRESFFVYQEDHVHETPGRITEISNQNWTFQPFGVRCSHLCASNVQFHLSLFRNFKQALLSSICESRRDSKLLLNLSYPE